MIQQDLIFDKDSSIVPRRIAGEVLLVPVRQNVGDMNSIYTLNETAALIWELIDGQHSLAEICDRLLQEYDVAPQQAWDDLLEITGALQEISAIVPWAGTRPAPTGRAGTRPAPTGRAEAGE